MGFFGKDKKKDEDSAEAAPEPAIEGQAPEPEPEPEPEPVIEPVVAESVNVIDLPPLDPNAPILEDEGPELDQAPEPEKRGRGRPKGSGIPGEDERCNHENKSGGRCKNKQKAGGYCARHMLEHGVGDGVTETQAKKEPKTAPSMFGGGPSASSSGEAGKVNLATAIDTSTLAPLGAELIDGAAKFAGAFLLGPDFGALMGAPEEGKREVADALKAVLDDVDVKMTPAQRLAATIALVYTNQGLAAFGELQRGQPGRHEEEVPSEAAPPPVMDEQIKDEAA